MTIRHKHNSTTTGTGATITVSTPTGYSNDVATLVPVRDVPAGGSLNNQYAYVLVDGNGTDWEYGYGKVSNTTFYRDQVIRSTNSDARINLSANTHTVMIPDGGLSNRVGYLHVRESNKSVTTNSSAALNMSIQTNGTSIDQFPGYAAPTSPATSFDAETIIKYSRGYTVQAYVEGTSASAGHCEFRLSADGNYYSYLEGRGSFALDTTRTRGNSMTTGIIAHGSPFSSASADGWFPGNLGIDVYNDSAGTATITGGLLITWYF